MDLNTDMDIRVLMSRISGWAQPSPIPVRMFEVESVTLNIQVLL